MGRPPKYKCNEHYFDKITTTEQAYVLGFIWADGHINNRSGLNITIKAADVAVLRHIKTCLQSNAPIKPKLVKARLYKSLAINRKMLTQALFVVGLRPNKSKNNALMPRIRKNLLPAFLRGLFDGDGSIWENTGFRANFSGGKTFLQWVDSVLVTYGVESNPIRERYKGNKNSCSLPITGRLNIQGLRRVLYEVTPGFCLNRKFARFASAAKRYADADKSNWRLNGTGIAIQSLLEEGHKPKEISRKLRISFDSARYITTQLRIGDTQIA
jgi:intein/homing endonuclease